jgi:hypothetical protein
MTEEFLSHFKADPKPSGYLSDGLLSAAFWKIIRALYLTVLEAFKTILKLVHSCLQVSEISN